MKSSQRLGASFLTLMAVAAITALGIWIGHTNPFTTWERLTGWAFATFLFGFLVGLSEILSRYRDEPVRATSTIFGPQLKESR